MTSCTICGSMSGCSCVTFGFKPDRRPNLPDKLPDFQTNLIKDVDLNHSVVRDSVLVEKTRFEDLLQNSKNFAETKIFTTDLMHMIWGNQPTTIRHWPEWAKKYVEENF